MTRILATAVEWFELSSPWELLAVVLALVYLLLAVQRSLWCWPCAFVSSAIYVALTFDSRLYMQATLNVFYVAMAVYGFWEWRRGRNTEGSVDILHWPVRNHVVAITAVLAASAVNGWWLANYSDAASPYLDSFTTWGGVITTWMVTRRVIENWLYWIVVDAATAYVFFQQERRVTGLLFLIYLVIVVQGYRTWRREERVKKMPTNAVAD